MIEENFIFGEERTRPRHSFVHTTFRCKCGFAAEAAHRVAVWKESHPEDTQPIGKASNEVEEE